VRFLFDGYLLDTDRRELHRGSALVALEPQVFDLLAFLVCDRDRVVSKDDLLASVWGGRIVSESTIASRINAARRAIGDNGEQQRLIRTIIGKGIRFVGAVRELQQLVDISGGQRSRGLPDEPSIAVLPFVDLSRDPEQEYFADGLVEEMTTALSRCPSISVVAPNSALAYKGRAADVSLIGGELGVRYVLEGSVRNGDDRIRVTARLVETDTGKLIWAERYDRKPPLTFAVQDAITDAVATAVVPAIIGAERRNSRLRPPESLEAWDAYRRGLWHMAKFGSGHNAHAQELFRQAIELSPCFSAGYRGLSLARAQCASLSHTDTLREVLRSAEAAARQAVLLDGSDAESRACLSFALCQCGEYESALAEAERALEKAIAIDLFDKYVRRRVPWHRPEDHAHMIEGLRKAGWRD
jgi:TolB-like protein